MDGRTPRSRVSLNPARRQQSGQQRAERLIGIECLLRQAMLGASRIALDFSKRIPLYKANP